MSSQSERMKCFRKKTSSETVDECVKRMNGVFSLENTESEYKKGGQFADKSALGLNFGSKFYKPLQVWGFIRKQSLHKAFLLFREQRGFKPGKIKKV